MIERYSHDGVASVWTEREKAYRWLQALAAGAATYGHSEVASRLMDVLPPPAADIAAKEDIYRHDVVGFVEALRDMFPDDPDVRRWLHYGLTSSDVVDTALGMAIRDVSRTIDYEVGALLRVWANLALQNVGRYRMARTHGRKALTVSAGRQWAVWTIELADAQSLLRMATKASAIGTVSGPAGDCRAPGYKVGHEIKAMERIGLYSPTHATQVVPRIARLGLWVESQAVIARVIGRWARWVRIESVEGVDTISEGKADAQRGSSSMPRKTNPVRSERLCGIERVVVGHARTIQDAAADLWPDRDISHSSVERILLPEMTELTAWMVAETKDLTGSLHVETADQPGPESTFDAVCRLMNAGCGHREAYELVEDPGFRFHGGPAYDWEREKSLWDSVKSLSQA